MSQGGREGGREGGRGGGREGGREGGGREREGGREGWCSYAVSCGAYSHYSVFQENSGANGIVSVGYSPMKFLGNNTFVANTGTTLRVRGEG